MSYITGKYLKYDPKFSSYIDKCIILIEKNFTPVLIYNIRDLIYNIYISNIDMTLVIKYIMNYYIKHIENMEYKYQIIQNATKYQYLMCQGNKQPLYLEAFILSIIEVLKNDDIIKIKNIKIKKI